MPFPMPTFPLKCNIWNLAKDEASVFPSPRPPDSKDVTCQLAQPQSLFTSQIFLNVTNAPIETFIIRFPAGTKVNDGMWNTSGSARGFGDVVELPPGSNIFYGVVWKCTVGQGYPNVHIRTFCYRLTSAVGPE